MGGTPPPETCLVSSSRPPSPSSSADLPSPPLFNKAWALVIILGRWSWGQAVKGVGVTPEERMVGMTEKKKQIRKKIKSRSSPFTRLKALKRIRNDQAWGLLSSLAIRLSWWRERHEWQGSRPSLGLTQREGVFFPDASFIFLSFQSVRNAAEISLQKDGTIPQCQTLITMADEIEKWGGLSIWEKKNTFFSQFIFTLL